MVAEEKSLIITGEESKRISVLKVWLTVMVVFIHSYGNNLNFAGGTVYIDMPAWLNNLEYLISQVLSRVAVPAFFFLAAYFLYRKKFSWGENVLKKVKTLAIPYLLINSFWVLAYFVAQRIPQLSSFFSNSDNLVANWGVREWLAHYFGSRAVYQPLVYPLWFVRNLFLLNLVAPLFLWVVKKCRIISAVLFVVLWLFVESTHVFFMDMQSICFWGLGCFFAVSGITLSSLDRYKIPLAISYPILVIASCLMRYGSEYPLMIVQRTGFLVGIAFWFVFTTKIKGERIRRILLFISGYSFSIYLFHEMNLFVLRKLLTKVLPHTSFFAAFLYLGMPVIIISFCLVLSRLLERFTPRLYALVTGGRKK